MARLEPEFELLDTGLFDESRYFDVEITFAKADTDDILMEVTIRNRGAESAELRILPQLWARNIWSWAPSTPRPKLFAGDGGAINLEHPQLPGMRLFCDGAPELLFCENETNIKRLYGADASGFFKDGINDYIVHGDRSAVNPAMHGTKMAAHYNFTLSGHGISHVRVRLAPARKVVPDPFKDFDAILEMRRAEADEFYEALQKESDDHDARLVQRQALAGLLWSKQYYYIDIPEWLNGDPAQPPPPSSRKTGRNSDWSHLNNADIISMPDKWEYPWYAAWDLAFHCVTLVLVDPEFAKGQLALLTREWYMHPNGQLPAYEWAFGDVNPPVHAWAAWRVYQMDRDAAGRKRRSRFS